jgi:hypothetical protein
MSRRALLTLLVGGAVTVAAGGAAVVYLTSSSSPDKTVLAYCNAIKDGDARTAYNQLSSGIQGQVNEQQFANNVQQVSSLKGVTNCSTSNVQVTGSTATVTLRVTIFGFLPANYTVTVIKENGVWKLNDAKFLGL